MKLGQDLLYLSNADIEACGIGVSDVDRAIEAMFAAKAAGTAMMKPKVTIHPPDGAWFLATSAALGAPPFAGVKWVGVAENSERGLPHIAGLIVLNDVTTGMPVAAMDARWVTAKRTAAITAVAARRLARADSASIGFIACGTQAHAHLAALGPHFPLTRLRAYSRRLSTAQAFAEHARDAGLDAEAVEDPRAAVEGMDIVITSTPAVPPPDRFLDAGWLGPGAFAGIVDMGLPWVIESLTVVDKIFTDDVAQAASEGLPAEKPYDGEVADLVAGNSPGRENAKQRTALLFAGVGVADIAVAALIYEQAINKGIGHVLPL
ncbi:MAG: ornithine cyclodeaminase family protein [Alphaproteobacteria bacterium]|nr:ornithine cyclodeaminase family protein [Alphaproteobacteria bacterium]